MFLSIKPWRTKVASHSFIGAASNHAKIDPRAPWYVCHTRVHSDRSVQTRPDPGESVWNQLNIFTGWADVDLSEVGVKEAIDGGKMLKAEGLQFDKCYTSYVQSRSVPNYTRRIAGPCSGIRSALSRRCITF